MPFHRINCIAVYNGKQHSYGRNWKIKIQNTTEDGSIVELTLPIIIQLRVNKNNDRISNYYGLNDIKLVDSDYLGKSLGEYESEVLQSRVNRRNEEYIKKEKAKADLVLEKKSSIELYRKRLSLIDSENILKSSLNEILTSSAYELSKEQDELFENCEYVLNCILHYINLARELSDKKEN